MIGYAGQNSLQGSVFVYEKPVAGWSGVSSETAILTAPDGASGDQLGKQVGISGGLIAAGAPSADSDSGSGNQNVGAVYVFEKDVSGWANGAVVSKLIPGDDLANGNFGFRLAFFGDTLAVGREAADKADRMIALYQKPVSGWTDASPDAVLLDASRSAQFGISLALDADKLLVGDQTKVVDGQVKGGVFIFDRPASGWANAASADSILQAADAGYGDDFGYSLSLNVQTLFVGAWRDDVGSNTDQGSVYVFSPPPSAPEIVVSGNGQNIVSGDTTPSLADGTDAGVVTLDVNTKISTFSVTNTGSTELTLGTLTLLNNSPDITVNQPLVTNLQSGETTTFKLLFNPTSPGLHTATVELPNNDADENPFRFAYQGTGGPELVVTLLEDYATVSSTPGNLSCSVPNINCREAFDLNTSVVLDIAANTGVLLSPVTWLDDCGNITGNSCTLSMDTSKQVRVDFSCQKMTLDTTINLDQDLHCDTFEAVDGFVVNSGLVGNPPNVILRAKTSVTFGAGSRVVLGGSLDILMTP